MPAFEVDLIHARWVGLRIVPATAPPLTSTFSGHAGRPDIASVLVQNHCNDLSFRVALEVELRVDNLVKELVLGVREDSEGGLPCSLCLEMIALEHDLQHAELGSVFAHVVAECKWSRMMIRHTAATSIRPMSTAHASAVFRSITSPSWSPA